MNHKHSVQEQIVFYPKQTDGKQYLKIIQYSYHQKNRVLQSKVLARKPNTSAVKTKPVHPDQLCNLQTVCAAFYHDTCFTNIKLHPQPHWHREIFMSLQKGFRYRGVATCGVQPEDSCAVPQLQTTTPTLFSLRREQPVGRNHSVLPRWPGMKPHSRVAFNKEI